MNFMTTKITGYVYKIYTCMLQLTIINFAIFLKQVPQVSIGGVLNCVAPDYDL